MNLRHILLCLALSLLGAGLQAQTDLPQVFSPNAAELGKYGKIPVSYFNGLPNISIPLTELRAKGYTLPIYLTYHAGGNKPDQHPGWVGLGWTLHAGGCINRIVNGQKDEMTWQEYSTTKLANLPPNAVAIPFDPGYFYRMQTVQSTDWSNGSTLRSIKESSNHYGEDYYPDEFQICIDDIHASFYFVGENQIKIVSKSNDDFTVEFRINTDEDNTGLYPDGSLLLYKRNDREFRAQLYHYIDELIVTNHDGTKYYFGGSQSAIEFSVVTRSKDSWNPVGTANTWMLTKIVRPDGETISFTYSRSVFVPVVKSDCHRVENWHEPFHGETIDHVIIDTFNPAFHGNVSFSFLVPSYLSTIKTSCSNESILFLPSTSSELGYEYTYQEFRSRAFNCLEHDAQNFEQLSYDYIKSMDRYQCLSRIVLLGRHEITFNYDNSESERLCLKRVSIINGSSNVKAYSMTYNTLKLPGYNSKQVDSWGYYNGITLGQTVADTVRINELKQQVDTVLMKAEILTRLTYPTGGYTEFEYEAHQYGKIASRFPFSLENSSGLAGGLRIRKLIDVEGEHEEVRRFNYTDGGQSSGILSGIPLFRTEGKIIAPQTTTMFGFPFFIDKSVDHWYDIYSERPLYILSTTDGNNVTYSLVKEIRSDGSRIEFAYTNHDSVACSDELPAQRYETLENTCLDDAFTSRQLFRGLLKSVKSYDSSGLLVQFENREYAYTPGAFIRAVDWRFPCSGLVMRLSYIKLYAFHPKLSRKTVISFFDRNTSHAEITEYTYDSHRRLTEAKRKVGGVTERDTYTYTGNFQSAPYAEMVSRNMIALPVESIHFRKDTLSSEKVVSADLVTWKKEGDFYVPAGQWKADIGQGVTLDSFNAFNGTAKDSRYGSIPDLSYTKYDVGGNLVLAEDRSGLPTTYFWTPNGCHPAAIFKGAKNGTRQEITQVVVASPVSSDLNELSGGSSIDLEFHCDLSGEVNVYLNFIKEYGQTVWWRIDYGTEHRWDWPTLGPEEELEIQTLFSGVLPAGNHIFQLTNAQGSFTELADDEEEDDSGQGPMTTVLHHTSRSAQPQLPSWGSITLTYPAIVHRPHDVRADECLFENFGPDDNGLQEGFDGGGTFTGVKTLDFVPYPNKTYTIDWQEWQPDGTWAYRSKTVPGTGTFTAGTAGKVMDHVRVFPQGTQVESYTWDAAGNLLSRTDSRGVTESYRYDGLGRLTGVYDNDGNKVEGYQYNYKNR